MAKGASNSAKAKGAASPANSPRAPDLAPVYLFHGPERFLQIERTTALRRALESAHGELSVTVFDGTSARAADILDECRSMSLMMSRKLVIVENADALVKGADGDEDDAQGSSAPSRAGPTGRSTRARGERTPKELMEAYVLEPDPSTTLVLRAGRWYPQRLDKAIAALGDDCVYKCEAPSDIEAAAWAVRRAKDEHSVTLERDAATLLIESIGPDLGRLDNEIAKLAMVEPAAPISADTVRAMTRLTREEDFWTIQDAVLSGDAPRAMDQLHILLEVSRINEVPIMQSLIDLARKVAGVSRGLRDREPVGALMGRYKLWGPAGEAVLTQARRLNPAAAAELYRLGVDAAHKHRSGQRDPTSLVEALTLRFAAAAAGKSM